MGSALLSRPTHIYDPPVKVSEESLFANRRYTGVSTPQPHGSPAKYFSCADAECSYAFLRKAIAAQPSPLLVMRLTRCGVTPLSITEKFPTRPPRIHYKYEIVPTSFSEIPALSRFQFNKGNWARPVGLPICGWKILTRGTHQLLPQRLSP